MIQVRLGPVDSPTFGESQRGRDRAGPRSRRCHVDHSRRRSKSATGAREQLPEKLARTPRTIARQRSWAHAKTRPDRRRHAMQRCAAIAADFLRRRLDAQPVATRGTLLIQALHGPAGQILHSDSPHVEPRWAGGEGVVRVAANCEVREQPPRGTERIVLRAF
jgi:hypothetical protein